MGFYYTQFHLCILIVELRESLLVGVRIGCVEIPVGRILGDQTVSDILHHDLGVGKIEPDVRVHPPLGMFSIMSMLSRLLGIRLEHCDTLALVDHHWLGSDGLQDLHCTWCHVFRW